MDFEWDEAKRLEVLRTRGIDFGFAALVFADLDRLWEVDGRRNYGEERRRTLGRAGNDLLVVVYTMRGNTCRIITAWKAGANDRSKYQAVLDGRDQGDG